MVMPLGDDDLDRRSVPVVTYLLIAINVIVWLLELSGGERFINGYSAIPFEITHYTDLVGTQTIDIGGTSVAIPMYPGPTPIYLTLLTSMFMHASWMHIIGNMRRYRAVAIWSTPNAMSPAATIPNITA